MSSSSTAVRLVVGGAVLLGLVLSGNGLSKTAYFERTPDAVIMAREGNRLRLIGCGVLLVCAAVVFGSLAYTDDPTGRLAETEHAVAELSDQVRRAQERVGALRQEPAIRTLTPGRLQTERENWQAERAEAQEETDSHGEWLAATAATPLRRVHPEELVSPAPDRGPGQGIGR